jgi:hypothetical protein
MSASLRPHESPAALRQTQVRVLDDIWLLTLFAVSRDGRAVVRGRLREIAFGPCCWAWSGSAPSRGTGVSPGSAAFAGTWHVPVLTALHAAGVVTVGIVWHHGGGLQNPVLLTVFVLPLVGACFISRWQPYFTAGLAILVVTVAALIEAPELRWHASGLGASAASLFADTTLSAAPFPGFYAPSGYYVALLESFIVLTLVSAAAADYLGTLFERHRTHAELARERAQSGGSGRGLIEHLPVPLLVEVDTLRISAAAERRADAVVLKDDAKSIGRNVLEAIRFSTWKSCAR